MTDKLVNQLKEGGTKVIEVIKEKAKGFSIGDLLLYGGVAIGGVTLLSLVSGIKPKPPTIPPNYTILDWENQHGNALQVKMYQPKPGIVITGAVFSNINWIHLDVALTNISPYMIPSGTIDIYGDCDQPILCNKQRSCKLLSAHFPQIPPHQTIHITGTFQWYGHTITGIAGPTATLRIFAKANYVGVEHELGDLGVIYLQYAI